MAALITYAGSAALLLAALALGWMVGRYRSLPAGKYCPHCGNRALPITSRRPIRMFRRFLGRRWCASCGWEGLRKRRRVVIEPIPTGGKSARGNDSKPAEPPLLWNDPTLDSPNDPLP